METARGWPQGSSMTCPSRAAPPTWSSPARSSPPRAGHGGDAGLAEMERACRPGGCVAIVWPNNIDWLAAHGYQYASFPGPMAVEFASHREAVELAEIFYPRAIARGPPPGQPASPLRGAGHQPAARPRLQGDRGVKVAIVAPLVSAIREPQGGGSQAFVSDLARGLAGRGHEVHVYAATGSQIPGVTVIDTGVDPGSLAATLYRAAGSADRDPAAAAPAFAGVYAAVRANRYDVDPQSRLRRPGDHPGRRAGRAGGAHAPPAAGRGDRGRAGPGRAPPAPPGGRLVACVSAFQASAWRDGRPGRRDPAAVRADAFGPLVGCGRRRRCLRGPAESGEGSRRGDRHRPAAGARIDVYGDAYDAGLRPRPDRPPAGPARRSGASGSPPGIDVGGHGPRGGRAVPGALGRAVRHGRRRRPGVRDSRRRVPARRARRDNRGWRDRLPGRARRHPGGRRQRPEGGPDLAARPAADTPKSISTWNGAWMLTSSSTGGSSARRTAGQSMTDAGALAGRAGGGGHGRQPGHRSGHRRGRGGGRCARRSRGP